MGLFLDFFQQDPTYDLGTAVDFVLQEFERDFKEYWGIDARFAPEGMEADDWELYQRLYTIAERLAEGALALARPGRLPETYLTTPGELEREAKEEEQSVEEFLAWIREAVDDDSWPQLEWMLSTPGPDDVRSKHQFFRTCMQLHAAQMFLSWPDDVSSRMVHLLDYLVRVKSERVRDYLSRVAECYVRGMDTEFKVMCRAVLEAALSDTIPAADVVKIRNIPESRVSLADWIQAADKVGVLDSPEVWTATEAITCAGDAAVHPDKECEREYDPDQLLEYLDCVLRRIGSLEE